ncbi:hypothetical protein [Micromonospora sp. NPDC050495]|uniref:hypothetical protein n=1 Tax=Micromonospora sp. NPDC050495 TaxID=3154936 RepID=UPI0033F498F4
MGAGWGRGLIYGDVGRCRAPGGGLATASRIINGSSKPLAEALRERVLAAVAELQDVPNVHAQLLARPHRSLIGVIVHEVSDPYVAGITRAYDGWRPTTAGW